MEAQLGTFNSLFEMPTTRPTGGACSTKTFNSLFEMRGELAAVAAAILESFNSLFEMQVKSRRIPKGNKNRTFNSLFEMHSGATGAGSIVHS